MRAEDLQSFQRPDKFHPFRITMNSGRTYDIGQPEMLHVTRSLALVFQLGPDGIADRFDMISLVLIEKVRHVEPTPATPSQGNGQGA